MDKETYVKYIIEMLDKIEDISHIRRIYVYVHKFFIRGTGK